MESVAEKGSQLSHVRMTEEAFKAHQERVKVSNTTPQAEKPVATPLKPPKAKNKYRNEPQLWEGQKFRSKKELKRYQELVVMEAGGHISFLRREVPYVLAESVVIQGRKRPALRYFADFTYIDQVGNVICEDCKGMRTPVYVMKRHLMKSVCNVDILET